MESKKAKPSAKAKSETAKAISKPAEAKAKPMSTKNAPLKLNASFENALSIVAKAADKGKKKAKKTTPKAE